MISVAAFGFNIVMPLLKKRHEREEHIQETPEVEDDIAENQFIVNWNHNTGIILDEALGGYPTYRIRLKYVEDLFEGKTQSYDKDYQSIQSIFGDGISSKASRAIVKAKHKSLYKGFANRVETGHVKEARDFVHLLRNGKRKNGEVLVFTYVIRNEIIWFAPTGENFLKDMVSKHAIHSNCAEEVTYSGEFFLVSADILGKAKKDEKKLNKDNKAKKGDNNEDSTDSEDSEEEKLIFIISNSSGTYKPDKKLLPKLKKLFEKNFNGLSVEAYDVEDETYEKYGKAVEEHNESLDTRLFKHFFGRSEKQRTETSDDD